jgi:hypothetical protein
LCLYGLAEQKRSRKSVIAFSEAIIPPVAVVCSQALEGLRLITIEVGIKKEPRDGDFSLTWIAPGWPRNGHHSGSRISTALHGNGYDQIASLPIVDGLQ